MPKFFATCPKGLGEALNQELVKVEKLTVSQVKDSGVGFECSWAKAYEVNLISKVASRVLKPVLDYEASSDQQIATGLKKHDFSKYIPKNGSFSLRVKVTGRSKYKDQRFVMNSIRVGLLVHFEKTGRGDIVCDPDDPDVEIFVTVAGRSGVMFSYSLNLSGDPLSHRGYRLEGERAPLRENLAAGLLRLSGWSGDVPLVDFFCGSGTFLIEAALLDQPNDLMGAFGFQRWANFSLKDYQQIIEGLKAKKKPLRKNIYGFDQDPRSLSSVNENLESLGLLGSVECKQAALKDLEFVIEKLPKGVVVLNPPYGHRLGTEDEALRVYKNIGETLKTCFKGWEAYILSPSIECTQALKMKSHFKAKIDNGGILCGFLGYKIRS